MTPNVLIVLPQRPGEGMSNDLWKATQPANLGAGFTVHDIIAQPCSLLNNNFNELWCKALNLNRAGAGITHFCMVHSDVAPEPGKWLETLLSEQRRVDADVLSSVIALKDERGLTSTGVMKWRSEQIKKFSVAECLGFPTTFDAEAAGYPGECLLLNTGCWVCDFTKPWVEKMCFRSYDTILPPDADHDEWRAVSTGEDWLFSMDCYRLGLRTYATTAVTVLHEGLFRYPNRVPWGTRQDEQEWGSPWCIQPPPAWADAPVRPKRRRNCGPSGNCETSSSPAPCLVG